MPSLFLREIQSAIRQGRLADLIQRAAEQGGVAKLIAAALNMEQDILTAHPELTFPVLYDRLIWEHGETGKGMLAKGKKARPANQEVVGILEYWEKEYGGSWLRSLWPPRLPLLPVDFQFLPVGEAKSLSRHSAGAFSPDGSLLVVGYGLYYKKIYAWDAERRELIGTIVSETTPLKIVFHEFEEGIFFVEGYKKARSYFTVDRETGVEMYPNPEAFSESFPVSREQKLKIDGCDTAIESAQGLIALCFYDDPRFWLLTKEQVREWKKIWKKWKTYWHWDVLDRGQRKGRFSEDGSLLSWKDYERLTIWSISKQGIQLKHSNKLPSRGIPEGSLFFSKDGQYLVSNGLRDQFDMYDTVVVLSAKTGKIVFEKAHRDGNWKDFKGVPPLAEKDAVPWNSESEKNWLNLKKDDTDELLFCLRGNQNFGMDYRVSEELEVLSVCVGTRKYVFQVVQFLEP